MAAQIISGNGNFAYTNNTGQNVRVIINYMRENPTENNLIMAWSASSGGQVLISDSKIKAIGKNLAYVSNQGTHGSNMSTDNDASNYGFPTEIMIAPEQFFSATCGAHNIVIIPENG